MKNKVVKYNHHGTEVSVIEHVKGKHREHCLCWQGCKHFKPESRKDNCYFANLLFNWLSDEAVPVLVAPVWECSKYEQEESKG